MTVKEVKKRVINSLVYIQKEYTFPYENMKLVEYDDILRCFEWLLNDKEISNGKKQ